MMVGGILYPAELFDVVKVKEVNEVVGCIIE